MELLFITTEHSLYEAEVTLRFRILREPLGMTRAEVCSPREEECLHLLALEGRRVMGCVLLRPEGRERGRLFQMAVDTAAQGQGVGRLLVRALEAELVRRGVRHVYLHARDTAIGFYRRLDYAVYGEPFVEVGVPHHSMQRTLSESAR